MSNKWLFRAKTRKNRRILVSERPYVTSLEEIRGKSHFQPCNGSRLLTFGALTSATKATQASKLNAAVNVGKARYISSNAHIHTPSLGQCTQWDNSWENTQNHGKFPCKWKAEYNLKEMKSWTFHRPQLQWKFNFLFLVLFLQFPHSSSFGHLP